MIDSEAVLGFAGNKYNDSLDLAPANATMLLYHRRYYFVKRS